MNKNIKTLIKLLDDEDQNSASLIMAELLKYENQIDSVLKENQETGNFRLRRRIHQIQSILSIRMRRKNLAKKLKTKQIKLFNGLSELHFMWYDNDPLDTVKKQWHNIQRKADKYQPDTIEKMAYFMRKTGFSISEEDEVDADYFCMGIVLEELIGADFILAAITQEIASIYGLKLKIIKVIGDFALIDRQGKILFPKNDWRLIAQLKKSNYDEWDSSRLLKLATSMLFLCAVSTESFRYVYTIGKCMAKISGKEETDFLPYPLNGASK